MLMFAIPFFWCTCFALFLYSGPEDNMVIYIFMAIAYVIGFMNGGQNERMRELKRRIEKTAKELEEVSG